MPYLRFSRDERGYEHTYVLHGLRTGSRPRLLYWFRTPPNVNVGRLPLDEDAIRAIEGSNADLTFDWAKMLRVKPPPAPVRPDDAGGRRSHVRKDARRGRGRPAPREAAAGEPLEVPAADAGADAAAAPAGARETEVPEVGEHPVAALVGDGGLARLRAQYAELRARVADSGAEPGRRAEASARVEALNPDGWRAGEEAVRGIERFEAEVAAIRADIGRRRRPSPGGRGREEHRAAGRVDEGGARATDGGGAATDGGERSGAARAESAGGERGGAASD